MCRMCRAARWQSAGDGGAGALIEAEHLLSLSPSVSHKKIFFYEVGGHVSRHVEVHRNQ